MQKKHAFPNYENIVIDNNSKEYNKSDQYMYNPGSIFSKIYV